MAGAAKVPVVGGPLCGLTVARGGARFVWVARAKRAGAGSAVATPDRRHGTEPYRLVEHAGRACYLYEGHRTIVCPSCGAFHGKAEGGRETPRSCQLCGADLKPRTAA